MRIRTLARWVMQAIPGGYARRLRREQGIYGDATEVHNLPPIFHYWSHTHARPMLLELGVGDPDAFFSAHLRESATRTGARRARFLSIGAGNCDTEIRIAQGFVRSGFCDFEIECLELNPKMLQRGRAAALAHGLADHLVCQQGDFNHWRSARRYDGVMANQSLHHVSQLEHLFDQVQNALLPGAWFVTSDMIGRKGHQRWPEALAEVHRFWRELPESYHWNHLLRRAEPTYINHDCSSEGFEGIRAHEVLPALLARFSFPVFIGFGNLIDVFVDRCFGPNFSLDSASDRTFIDRVHARDEELLANGTITPTHMFAVMSCEPEPVRHHARGLRPERCVRA